MFKRVCVRLLDWQIGVSDVGTTARRRTGVAMNIVLAIIVIVAIIVAIFSGLNAALSWLLWVAIIVGVIALIAFLFRLVGGRNRV
jgi:hypothetical protein